MLSPDGRAASIDPCRLRARAREALRVEVFDEDFHLARGDTPPADHLAGLGFRL